MVKMEDINLDDIDYADIENQFRLESEDGIEHIMVIDGLPKVDESKEKKVVAILRKVFFDKVGAFLRDNGAYFIKEQTTQMGTGCAIFEFDNEDQMKAALNVTDGHALDKNHTLIAYPFSDVERLANQTEAALESLDEAALVNERKQASDRPFSKEWLLDKSFRDQFLTYHQDHVSLWWNEKSQPAESVFSQKHTADAFQWSSGGSFLASFHAPGIILWEVQPTGLIQYKRLAHPQVSHIAFSPKESYATTFRHAVGVTPDEPNLHIWHLATGSRIWSGVFTPPEGSSPSNWLSISWSHDDRHFAFGQDNGLYVYGTRGDQEPLLVTGKGPLRQEGISGVMFAPSQHSWLAYWCPESVNTPAKVAVLNIPSLQVVRTKNLFHLTNVSLQWHHRGEFLAVLVEKCKGKAKKSPLPSVLEVFHMTAKDIPVDVIELTGTCSQMAWEPHGHILALIEHPLEQAPTSATPAIASVKGLVTVSFYDVSSTSASGGSSIKCLERIERKNVTRLLWNPKGKFIVFLGLDGSSAGHLEFWGVTDKGELDCLHTGEHYMATSVEWDPSGRFLLTAQSILRYQMESVYMIWDVKGQVLHRVAMDKLRLASWRPRPPTLLSLEQQKEAVKSGRHHHLSFEQQDSDRLASWMKQGHATKLQLQEDWFSWHRLARLQWGLDATNTSSATPAATAENEITDVIEELLEQTEQFVD